MDDFHLYLTRDLVRNSEAPPSSSLPPASLEFATNPEETAQNGAVPKACLAIPKPMLSLERKPSLLERAANEGFAILQSPKNQIVKEGQVLCYIDQLGGEIPIENPLVTMMPSLRVKTPGNQKCSEEAHPHRFYETHKGTRHHEVASC
ncbi:hypothetical protein CRG98_008467 [Punica granatum]|uniref:Lipoyl-binding domain-containing protein n=1 Tax=Punica granatum TaxID=22663 RepID=A0A2I0KRS8_PUNGR|nr:hypothetical protein CRG98_008467 [Punica granatum]